MYPEIYGYMGGGDGTVAQGFLLAYYLFSMLFSSGFAVMAYVLNSLGLHTMAKRRGIRRPWLSWLPVGTSWILGCISDQYQFVAKGKIRKRRKLLMLLEIATYALLIFFCVYFIGFVVNVIASHMADTLVPTRLIVPVLIMIGSCSAMCAVAIVLTVFQYIAYYDLFRSANPNRAVAFLVLSIFFSFLLPIFVFVSRKKEMGMPPRKSSTCEPVPEVVEGEIVEAQEEDFEE